MSYCPPSTPSRTPSAKRRNSLPNGEGLRLDYSKMGEVQTSQVNVKAQEAAIWRACLAVCTLKYTLLV